MARVIGNPVSSALPMARVPGPSACRLPKARVLMKILTELG